MITQEQIRLVDAAMLKADGNRRLASRVLQMDRNRLNAVIDADPGLTSRWPTRAQEAEMDLPTDAEALTRGPVISQESALAEAMAKEDSKFAKGIEALGLPDELSTLARSFRAFHAREFASVVDLTGGGVSVVFLRLCARIAKLEDRIEKGFPPEAETPEAVQLALNEERMVWDAYLRMAEQIGKYADMCNRSSMVRAKIDLWKKTGSAAKRKQKAGWSGPLVAVQGDSVTIQDGRSRKHGEKTQTEH